ncbi:DUF1573 domain-containing protein [Hymenobacter lapidiphilus]|uniref:DUF1573 domain-containing protein n=1 Tax=Hymenobacter lapidiphilus TaxID=2608003 RepID=A0A7Y7PLP8_9BACT|nr:DUF1573 domain-containing protein [Hymenobacter lapidiphilus]NVO30085.1 DUF1573 domain-containing protein [Hymenobacter lapidiphilus]
MKHLLFLLLSFATLTAAHAQGVLTFQGEQHDFGSIPEGVMASHEFRFKNTGNQPIIIANVQASCGCTTPDWTKTPILPGKSGMVKAVYSSAGRPGVFNKTVTVVSNATTPSAVLTIKGNVLNKEQMRSKLTPAQLAQSPRLTLDRARHDFGKAEAGQTLTARFKVTNSGKQDLVLSAITSGCYCVGYKNVPSPIKPGETAVVELVYNQRRVGQQQEAVVITSNDLTGDAKLTLTADLVKDLNAGSMLKESGTSVPFK